MRRHEAITAGVRGDDAADRRSQDPGSLDHGFRLAEASVEPRSTSIRVGDERRRIDYKAMQVLLCLASRPDEKISKQEILASVWPGQAVCDEVLTVAVSTLRRALGDDARAPRFIQTIPRVGYRLIAPVTSLVPEPVAGRSPRRGPRTWRFAVTASVLSVLGLLVAQTIPMRSSPAEVIGDVAVLPFANDTGDPDQEFLADGLTQALIIGLAREPRLRVTPRRSVMRLKRSGNSLADIASELGVDALVEGSVQRFEDRLRLSAALVDAQRNRVLWTSSLDTPVGELSIAQQQLTQEIARRLRRGDVPAGGDLKLGSQPLDSKAFRAYVRGRALAGDCARDSRRARQALADLRRAISLEPDFAVAHSALSRVYLGLALQDREVGGPEHPRWVSEARQAVETALALDPSLAEAHTVRAVLLASFDWRFPAAEAAFGHALSLDPEDPRIHYAYSKHLASLGRFDEALAHSRRVEALEPEAYFDPTAARILFRARRYRLAIAELDERIAVAGDEPEPYFLRADILNRLGRPADAIASFTHGLRLQGIDDPTLSAIEEAFAGAGFEGVYVWLLPRIQEEILDRGPVTRSRLMLHAGDYPSALDYLKHAFEVRDPDLLRIATDPTFDPLRHQARFQNLVARVGLARAQVGTAGSSWLLVPDMGHRISLPWPLAWRRSSAPSFATFAANTPL